ncbi:hypothetical protein ABW636_06215 [Aquimarina sp. 2201CG1-2-11]|uniref:peroxiredoxin family protein n=1 Tax=Aquimarina discodermiae TaxID=3231043 RepID=UPI00346328D0
MQRIVNVYLIDIILISCFLCGCNTSIEEEKNYAYFGGEIVNPNTNYIVMFKGNNYNDTIRLDKNNRFLYKIENLEEGVYTFKHNPENQVVLLEKGDSILIRLNTIEFDESLVFTGQGSRKNNFLIDMYLQNEIERKKLTRANFMSPSSYFKKNQDSLLNNKLVAFDKLVQKNELSDLAKKITHSTIVLDYYGRHEIFYNSRYKLGGMDLIEKLPPSFFSYRNRINFNDNDLERLYSYHRFLNYYFANATIANYGKKLPQYHDPFGNTIYRLKMIDSLIDHSFIKNSLLRGTTIRFLLDSKNNKESNLVLNQYLAVSSNKKSQRELKKLSKSISNLRPNKLIPDQDLITSKGEIVKLSSLFNKPITALYFWSMESKDHYVRAHKKAAYLNTLYPDIDFIAVNTDGDQTKNWLKTIQRHHYKTNYEYGFKYPKCSSEELVIHYRNKVILVDNQGKIINPNADLFASIFERQLMQYSQLASLEN